MEILRYRQLPWYQANAEAQLSKQHHQLLLLTKDITPNQNTYLLVSQFLEDFLTKPRVGLLSFGFILALFYSSNAMLGIMRSFNKSATCFCTSSNGLAAPPETH